MVPLQHGKPCSSEEAEDFPLSSGTDNDTAMHTAPVLLKKEKPLFPDLISSISLLYLRYLATPNPERRLKLTSAITRQDLLLLVLIIQDQDLGLLLLASVEIPLVKFAMGLQSILR